MTANDDDGSLCVPARPESFPSTQVRLFPVVSQRNSGRSQCIDYKVWVSVEIGDLAQLVNGEERFHACVPLRTPRESHGNALR